MVSARKLVGYAKWLQVEQESFKQEVTVVNYCGQVPEKFAYRLTVCMMADVSFLNPSDRWDYNWVKPSISQTIH